MRLTHQGITRHETDETTIATLLRKGWVEASPEPEPEPPGPPEQVTKRQLLHWLEFDHGVADPETLIPQKIDDAFPPANLPRENHFAHREWSRAQNIRRDNALVPLLAAVLQIADVDAAFREMEEKYG